MRCGQMLGQAASHFSGMYTGSFARADYTMCRKCARRDQMMIFAVNSCMRLFGDMVTINEIYEVYSNERFYTRLNFDPFHIARVEYKGKEALSMKDFDRWFEAGIFEQSEDGILSKKAEKERRNIQQQIKKNGSEKEKTEPETEEPAKKPSNGALTRLVRKGGAAKGKERWEIEKELHTLLKKENTADRVK